MQPRLSELVLTLQNEIQQAIEVLSSPQTRILSQEAPSAAFVIPNSIRIRMPIVLAEEAASIPEELLRKTSIPIKPYVRSQLPESKMPIETIAALTIGARIPTDKEVAKARIVGELEAEFLIHAKL